MSCRKETVTVPGADNPVSDSAECCLSDSHLQSAFSYITAKICYIAMSVFVSDNLSRAQEAFYGNGGHETD